MNGKSVSATVERFERRAQRERSVAKAVAQAEQSLDDKMAPNSRSLSKSMEE